MWNACFHNPVIKRLASLEVFVNQYFALVINYFHVEIIAKKVTGFRNCFIYFHNTNPGINLIHF